jgi:SAM-dependent methyltransferase
MDEYFQQVSAGYDELADEYVAHIYHELEHKPLDREWLSQFVVETRDFGPICEVGCGPGHVARYLHEQGAQVLGIDLSPRMIELALQLNPGIEFRQGNMAALDVSSEAWGGIVAFYALIHIPKPQVPAVLREFKRVLRPGGQMLMAFHRGDEVRHLNELWEKQVSIDFIFFQREEMESYLREAGFEIVESIERQPYEGFEVATQRVYVRARKPRAERSSTDV